MFSCKQCEKVFDNHRALNAHQISHKDGSRYKVSRKTNIGNQEFNCLQCNTPFKYKNSTNNKFCSIHCYQLYRWENIYIPKIESGEGNANVKRYIKEKFGDKCSECGQKNTWNNKSLILQLDHIDGNSDNNMPNNLRLLCPNCHSQTNTFGNGGYGNKCKKNTKRNNRLRKFKLGH